MLEHMMLHREIFICPICGGDLDITPCTVSCRKCDHDFPVQDGIPLLFCHDKTAAHPGDVTDIVKSFYEESPFPDYDGFENAGDLIQRAQKAPFTRLLNKQIPFNVRVLEVGCGTGQLSNFLGIARRTVFGADMCVNSLKLAADFKRKNGLNNVGFYQMNLFNPVFKEESFHLVVSNGVLHATSNPFAAFQSIARLVKTGGYIIIGLYNTYGRIGTDIRRVIFNVSVGRFQSLDPHLRKSMGARKKRSWFMDQYKHPHESKHTIGEVLDWFDKTGFMFINGIPKTRFLAELKDDERIFAPNQPGNKLDHFLVQMAMMFSGSKEGGLFVMIGKKI